MPPVSSRPLPSFFTLHRQHRRSLPVFNHLLPQLAAHGFSSCRIHRPPSARVFVRCFIAATASAVARFFFLSSIPPFLPQTIVFRSGLFFSPPPPFPASVLRCSRIHSHSLFSIAVSSPPSSDIWRWPPSCTSSVVGFSSPPSPLPSASTPFPFLLPTTSAAALAFPTSFPLAISASARASKPSVASKFASLIPHLAAVALLSDEARHPRSLLFFFSLFCPTSTVAFSSLPSTTVRRLPSLLLLLRRPSSPPTAAAAVISSRSRRSGGRRWLFWA